MRIGFPKKISPPIDQSCVGYWKLDEASGNIKDWSGKGNTGIAYYLTYSQPGRFGTACSFNGTTSYINCGTGSSLNIEGIITIEAWIKSNGYTSKSQAIWLGEKIATGETKNYLVLLTTQSIAFDQYPPSGGSISSNRILDYNTWYHIVAIQNGTWRGIYINGILDKSDNSAETFSGGTIDAWIIGQRIYNASTFNGTIDDIRIYNRALSAQEIKRHYMAGR